MAQRIPDDALVVRGGKCSAESIAIGMLKPHPSGLVGASVQCATGVPLEELASVLPNRQLGATTVGAVRAAGGDVIRTSGAGHHATVVGLTPEQLSQLLTLSILNPARAKKKGGRP